MKREGMNTAIMLPVAMVGVTALAGGTLVMSNVKADDVVSTATVTVPVSCTMSGSGMNSHTAEVPNGTTVENIGTTTLKAYCNDDEGFSVYAVGFSDDTLGNTYLRDATLGQTADINTSTTFSGTSAWAMKMGFTSGTYSPIIAGSTDDTEKDTGDTDYSTWAQIPSQYTRVTYRNSGTDVDNNNIASVEGSSITTTYKAFVSSTQPAGTYVGKVKFVIVHPASNEPLELVACEPSKICYNANGSNVEGTMGMQSLKAKDWSSCGSTDYATYCQNGYDSIDINTLPESDTYVNEATLLASNFSRAGYGFAGWSDVYDYATNPSAHFYGPNEDIMISEGVAENGLSLYAVWIKSTGSIQSWNGCNNLAIGAVTALTDQRDDETYAVAKLADGNCWMIENLRLENAGAHNSDGTLAQGYGTSTEYGNFSGLADPESAALFAIAITANSLYSTDGSNDTINIGNGDNAAYRFPRYNHDNTNNRSSNPTNKNEATYGYGNYYTWHGAIADLNPNNTRNQSTIGTSLCPTGWHLPTGGGPYASTSTTGVNVTGDVSTYREFYNLGYKIMDEIKTAYEDTITYYTSFYSSSTINTAGDTATKAFRKYPNNFIYSGYVFNGSVVSRGVDGYYWSSTAEWSLNAYHLSLSSSSVSPGADYTNKYYGKSIRCLISGL